MGEYWLLHTVLRSAYISERCPLVNRPYTEPASGDFQILG